MYYFVNEYLLPKNSSVEHSAMQRVKLFNHYRTPAQIVTKAYDRLLHQTLQKFNVPDQHVLNMFDYFQQATAVAPVVRHTEDLHLPVAYAVEVGNNFSRVFNGDDLVENVGFIPGTIGRVFYQEYLDNQGNRLSTDLWDWRGFKSATQYFGQNGKLVMERYYTPAGETVMEQYFVANTAGEPLASRILLENYQGQAERFFQNTTQLFNFFIAELSRLDPETTTLISDRPGTGIQPLLQLDDASRKYVMVPIYHAKTLNDPLHAPIDGFLEPAFDNAPHFNGFITPTAAQAQHLQTRYPKMAVTNIEPVATTPIAQSTLRPWSERGKELLVVGRLAPDRQLDQLIRVVALVKHQQPEIQCDIYGFGDPEYQKTLQNLIGELKLTANVRLLDYQADLADHYDDYRLLVNTDIADGGPMSMLEAQAHGLPVVSYRFDYGPQDYIQDGQDGYLIGAGDQLTMADQIVKLMASPKLWTEFSEAAFKKQHTEHTYLKTWHRWQRLLAI
ncbi:glycosyltransferase [Lactiplantibacillus brownii]|uniref:glycosyltransferase n=1 Tax=Lactiplantibacillus brownii TaxID=3069269 RepID=UPI0038B2C7C9